MHRGCLYIPHIRQGMYGFYIMIYGCDDAFFKLKEPWSYKPWLENFAEFTTLR